MGSRDEREMIPKSNTRGTNQGDHRAAIEEAEASPLGMRGTPDMNRRSSRWSVHRQRNIWFLLVVLLLGIVTIFALASGTATVKQQANSTQQGTPPATTTSGTSTPAARVLVRTAQTHLYPFPSSNIGLMQPAVDAQGNVWVGEMYANRLARLDSRTGFVTTWEPPNGKNGLMTAVIDTHGNIWFVEQGANYIGRFDPVRQTFRIFPLGTVQGRPMGPQALQFDAKGLLWFTAAVGGRIGRLDPATGRVQTWPVPPPRTGVPSSPFSLTVMPNGQVWFGDITGGAVGHLDPATGHVTLYHLADPQAGVFSMAHDAKGRIWFTELQSGKLGMIDPTTDRVIELPVPTVSGTPPALYGLVVAPSGEVWFVNNAAHALVRYSPGDATYTFFQLSLPSEAPYGLTLAPDGRLWFTAVGSSANAVGEMTPE